MKFNGFLIILLLLLSLFFINAVGAVDGNVALESECSDLILDDSDCNDDAVEKLSKGDEDVISKTIKTSGSTFSDIQTKINGAKDGDVISLTGKTYSATGNESIIVSKRITIQGASDNVVLDAKNLSSGIISSSKGITLKNIKFINSNMAIYASSDCTIINCTFEGNDENGVYILGLGSASKVTVENSIFKNNGNGIFLQNTDSKISNCEFDNNVNLYSGGAISIHSSNINIVSSNFTNNVGYFGGAIYIDSILDNLIISDSLFVNNAAESGSAIADEVDGSYTLENNVFVNNKAKDNVEGIGFLNSNAILKDNVIKNDIKINSNAQVSIAPTGNNFGDLVEVKFKGANNVPLSNKKVTILAYKGDYSHNQYHATTDSKGIARLAPVDSADNYDFIVIADAGNFKVVSSLNNIQYYKTSALIKANNVVATYNSGKQFTAQILNKNTKKAVAGVKVSIFVSGNRFKSYDCISNNDGKVSLDLSSLSVGKWTVEVYSYDNTENIELSKVKFSFKVNKAPTKVKAPKVTNKFKKSKYFKVIVKAYNKPLKNVKVKVKVFTGKKSKIYNIKTNKNGLSKFNTKKLSRGKHKVVISSGNKNYKISAKSTIKIK